MSRAEKTIFDALAVVGGVGLTTGFLGGAYFAVVPVLEMNANNNWGAKGTQWGQVAPSLWNSNTPAAVGVEETLAMRLTFMYDLPGDLLDSSNPNWFNNKETPTQLGYPQKKIFSLPVAYYLTAALVVGLVGRGGMMMR